MEAFWAWFIGEAGAAWVIGSLSLIVGIAGAIYGYINRKRPKHIVVEETKRLSLVDIHSSFQDRITVNYKLLDEMPSGQKKTGCIGGALKRSLNQELEFKTLHQVEFVIYNSGTENFIEPFEFEIDFYSTEDRDTKGIEFYWEMFLDDPRAKCNAQLPSMEDSDLETPLSSLLLNIGCKIELDRLNSWRKERDRIRGYLVSEKPVFLESRYQGTGWSSEYRSARRSSKVVGAIGTILAIFLGITILVRAFTQLDAEELIFGVGAVVAGAAIAAASLEAISTMISISSYRKQFWPRPTDDL